MRLTKRGWNNVLIFSTLFMILLFNTTHQKFVEGEGVAEKRPLIAAEAIIQVIDYSGIKLERIGSNWRVQSVIEGDPNAAPEQLVQAWQSLTFETLSELPELSANSYSLPVLVQAIGLDSQQIFVVYIEPDSGLAYFHNKILDVWQLGSIRDVKLLVPLALLKEVE